jgi:hypothetical protein
MPPTGTAPSIDPARVRHHVINADQAPLYFKNKLSYRDRLLIRTLCATLKVVITYPPGEADYEEDITGVDSRIIEHFIPPIYARQFTDNSDHFTFPASSLYQPGLWPDTEADPMDRYGRPLTAILCMIRDVFAQKNERVYLLVPVKLYKLCPMLRIFNTLGMISQTRQIEMLIAQILRYKSLEMEEMKAVWKFETDSPPAPPMPPGIEIQRGFSDTTMMRLFADNLRNMTSQQWQWDMTGRWNEVRKEYWGYINQENDLNKLVYAPDLKTWIEIFEKSTDRDAKLLRQRDWYVIRNTVD